MKACEQAPGLSTYDHGLQVSAMFKRIIAGDLHEFLPDCLLESFNEFKDRLLHEEILETYQILHDIGKYACLVIDDQGRRHFPNHAEVSAKIWRESDGHPTIGELIRRDMDMHTLKSLELEGYDRLDLAPSLLLTAWAEIFANAEMFGGRESISFKMKYKSLSRATRAIRKAIKN
jgi:hypothetical protein